MFKGNRSFSAIAAHRLRVRARRRSRRTQGCIVLKSIAEVEQEVVNDKGEKSQGARAGRQGRAGHRSHLDRHG